MSKTIRYQMPARPTPFVGFEGNPYARCNGQKATLSLTNWHMHLVTAQIFPKQQFEKLNFNFGKKFYANDSTNACFLYNRWLVFICIGYLY